MWLTGESPLQLVRIRDDAYDYADLDDGFLRLVVIDDRRRRRFHPVASVAPSGDEYMLAVLR